MANTFKYRELINNLKIKYLKFDKTYDIINFIKILSGRILITVITSCTFVSFD